MRKIAVILVLLASFAFSQSHQPLKAKIVRSASGASVSLTCTSPGSVAVAFNFYRGTVSGGPYTILGTSPMVATCAYTDATVSPGTTYYYVATALDIAVGATCPTGQTCESGYSNQATAVVPFPPPPNPPTGLTVGTIVGTSVPLEWVPPVPQTGVYVDYYAVFTCSGKLCPNPVWISSVSIPGYTDTSCTPRPRVCRYFVRAHDTVAGLKVVTARSNIATAVVQ
jgi:hypothetical protein